MERSIALGIIEKQLTEHRFLHTVGVMNTAIELASRYGTNQAKAELAAIFHDYAKFRPKNEMEKIIIEQKMPSDLLIHNTELWHAPVGSFLVNTEVGIEDQEILDAIKYHTSGREKMTILEKVIFLADYIEPGRHFPGVEEVREAAKQDLDYALILSLRNTILFLLNKNQSIYPDTLFTYNALLLDKKGGTKG